jgi:glutamyl-tRNA synthetase
VQIAEQAKFLFVSDDAFAIDENSWKKVVATERAKELFDAVIDFVAQCDWTDEIDVRPVLAELGMKPGKVMHVLFTAIEGSNVGLPIFDSISLLGRERALRRLKAARALLAGE